MTTPGSQIVPSLFVDPAGGLSGDMFLAALCGLGFDVRALESVFRQAGFAVTMTAPVVRRNGLAGWQLRLEYPEKQPLRHLADIYAVLASLPVSDHVRSATEKAFVRLAEVEAEAHGIPLEQVHFHEVGAMDTIIDVLGAFFALESLGVAPERVSCGPLPWFHGVVNCSHGQMPLPAPATASLMQGKPVRPSGADYELITPTGALIIDQLCQNFAPGPTGVIKQSVLSFGQMDRGSAGLRLFLIEPMANRPAEDGLIIDQVWVLESHIDHLTGEELGYLFDQLMRAGALDVFHQPGVMKKNRPAGTLTVICPPDRLGAVQKAFFTQSLTLGIRRSLVERAALPRSEVSVRTPYGEIKAKEFILDGRRIVRPEYESLLEAARRTGRSLPELRLLLQTLCAGTERQD